MLCVDKIILDYAIMIYLDMVICKYSKYMYYI